LRKMLLAVPLRRAILTNSNIEHAERILSHMAIRDCFEAVIDIKARNFQNKPAPESYELLSTGVMDGTLFPAESIESFKIEKVIRHATVDGARVAGLGRVTGSLEPGMQADVLVLRTDRPNVFPINDPIGAGVWGMDTSNVDWVFVSGRVVMREGVLEAEVQRARGLATTARERVAAASGLVVGAASGGDG